MIIPVGVLVYLSRRRKPVVEIPVELAQIPENENTIVYNSMGLSKHAALQLEASKFAQVKKLAAGGGGEVFLAKAMDSKLKQKHGEMVIQKVVFVKNQFTEEGFYQEVAIMVMLSKYPYFAKLIGYTVTPLTMFMKYYPDGSLDSWIKKYQVLRSLKYKFVYEIASALSTMHSHDLAHCDIKTQNILIEIQNNTPGCCLTDFGIRQVLSEKIMATKLFNVVNIRGLSVAYASPEAFQNFRSKNYSRADFRKYDIYSYACIIYVITAKTSPWS